MAGYDIRTMTGHEVLVGMVNATNTIVTFKPKQVTFSNVTADPTPERLGRVKVTMAAEDYRGTVELVYGRIDLASAFTDERTLKLLVTATQEDLIREINNLYGLNLGVDDYVTVEGGLSNGGTTTITIEANPTSLVWFGKVELVVEFGIPRYMEDGSVRLMEDGSVREIEN